MELLTLFAKTIFMLIGQLLYLALAITAFLIGLAAKTPGKAIIFAALSSVFVSASIVLYDQSFFPFEASDADKQAYDVLQDS